MKVPERITEQKRQPNSSPQKDKGLTVHREGVPVHLMDIPLEKGMHCVDCHCVQDAHGDGKLYQEVRAAIEIQCIDCHGTITKYAALRTSGPSASPPDKPRDERPDSRGSDGGRDLTALRTPF